MKTVKRLYAIDMTKTNYQINNAIYSILKWQPVISATTYQKLASGG